MPEPVLQLELVPLPLQVLPHGRQRPLSVIRVQAASHSAKLSWSSFSLYPSMLFQRGEKKTALLRRSQSQIPASVPRTARSNRSWLSRNTRSPSFRSVMSRTEQKTNNPRRPASGRGQSRPGRRGRPGVAREFQPPAHQSHVRSRVIVRAMLDMPFPVTLRNEHLDGLTDQSPGRIAEHSFGGRVHEHDHAVLAGDERGVGSRLQQPAEPLLAALPLDRLALQLVLRCLCRQGCLPALGDDTRQSQARHGVDVHEELQVEQRLFGTVGSDPSRDTPDGGEASRSVAAVISNRSNRNATQISRTMVM